MAIKPEYACFKSSAEMYVSLKVVANRSAFSFGHLIHVPSFIFRDRMDHDFDGVPKKLLIGITISSILYVAELVCL